MGAPPAGRFIDLDDSMCTRIDVYELIDLRYGRAFQDSVASGYHCGKMREDTFEPPRDSNLPVRVDLFAIKSPVSAGRFSEMNHVEDVRTTKALDVRDHLDYIFRR